MCPGLPRSVGHASMEEVTGPHVPYCSLYPAGCAEGSRDGLVFGKVVFHHEVVP